MAAIIDSIETKKMIPTILWAEDTSKIYLRCIIQDALEPEKVIINGKILELECKSKNNDYFFSFELINEINEEINVSITNHLLLTLEKSSPGLWRKLTDSSEYKKYIKVDWDRWQDSDDDEESDQGMGGMGGMGGMEGMGNMEEMGSMM